MAHIVVRQPDGLLAVFSTIVDDFVLVNSNTEDISAMMADLEREKALDRWRESCLRAHNEGTSSFRKKTWNDLCDLRREVHGFTSDPRDPEPEEDLSFEAEFDEPPLALVDHQ